MVYVVGVCLEFNGSVAVKRGFYYAIICFTECRQNAIPVSVSTIFAVIRPSETEFFVPKINCSSLFPLSPFPRVHRIGHEAEADRSIRGQGWAGHESGAVRAGQRYVRNLPFGAHRLR